jgi:hypothetical protein
MIRAVKLTICAAIGVAIAVPVAVGWLCERWWCDLKGVR